MRIPSFVILSMSILYFVLFSVYDISDLSGIILLVFNIILCLSCILDIKNSAKLSPMNLDSSDMNEIRNLVSQDISVSDMIQFGLSIHEMMNAVSKKYPDGDKIKDFTFFVVPAEEEKELVSNIKNMISEYENRNKQ